MKEKASSTSRWKCRLATSRRSSSYREMQGLKKWQRV